MTTSSSSPMPNVDLSGIFPPSRLQLQWGFDSHKAPNPSGYMREKIAQWCAEEGARRVLLECGRWLKVNSEVEAGVVTQMHEHFQLDDPAVTEAADGSLGQ